MREEHTDLIDLGAVTEVTLGTIEAPQNDTENELRHVVGLDADA